MNDPVNIGARGRGRWHAGPVLAAALGLLSACTAGDVVPGETRTAASSAFALDAWEMSATMAHLQPPEDCETAQLVDTQVLSEEVPPVYDGRRLVQGVWSEVWVFDRCGTPVRIRADFRADGQGTAGGRFSAL